MGFVAQQTVLTLYKLGLPFVGGFFTIPLVFGLTYAMGKVAEYYFDQRRAGEPMDTQMAKNIWAKALKEGRKLGKKKEDEIRKGADQ